MDAVVFVTEGTVLAADLAHVGVAGGAHLEIERWYSTCATRGKDALLADALVAIFADKGAHSTRGAHTSRAVEAATIDGGVAPQAQLTENITHARGVN